MKSKAESPRFILILGSLFLLAYAAYNVGIAWVDLVPGNSLALEPATQTSTPTITPTPSITPTSVPLYWITPTNTPGGATATQAFTPTAAEKGSEAGIASTPVPAAPTASTASTNLTPEATPTASTSTPSAGAYPGPEATPTTAAGSGAYPGPEATSTPQTEPEKTQNPYPGPGNTPRATTDSDNPYPGPQPTRTPSLNPTATPDAGQPTPTQIPLPTQSLPASTALPLITTLTYSETLVVSNGTVHQAVWSQDGSILAFATSKGMYQYDAQLLKKQAVFDAGASVLSATFAFNDAILVAGGADAVIRWWDLETEGYLGALPGHLLGVARLDLPNLGNFLASGSDDATVRVWDISTALNQGVGSIGLSHHFRDPVARVMDVDASPNGEMVAAASQHNVHIWQPQSGVLIKNISQPEGWYSALAFSPDNQTLTTAFDGRRLEFWNTSTWQRTKFILLSKPVQALAYSPDGIFLAVGYADGHIQIWDVRSKFLRADLTGQEDLTSLAFAPINHNLVTSSRDGNIRVWNISPLYGSE